ALNAISSSGYAGALDQLSGEIHASTQTALLDTGDMVIRTLSSHMHGGEGLGTQPAVMTEHSQGTDDTLATSSGSLWGHAMGSWNTLQGDSNTAKAKYDMGGLFIGGDKKLANGWYIGGAIGYTGGKVRVGERDSKADINS